MSLNNTPSGERVHIGFFGRRNAGKSSVVNAFTNQELSVVSDVKGTTTDPVLKSMELLPMGPVVIIDTPGFDDEGALGELRGEKDEAGPQPGGLRRAGGGRRPGRDPRRLGAARPLPAEGHPLSHRLQQERPGSRPLPGGAGASRQRRDGEGIEALKERVARLTSRANEGRRLVGDLLSPGDLAVLVTPIDSAAPKGRLILPQQQAIRDILDAGCMSLVVKEDGLKSALEKLSEKPRMVITDSQAFGPVAKATPRDIPLTSFSILMARYKGFLTDAVKGVAAIDTLADGDRVLIAEGCTHHRNARTSAR